MNGWIKLHRKLLDNKIYQHDPTAWRVFLHLLLLVDHRTGSWDIGRFVLAESLDIKPTTAYQALKRLQKAKMVDIKSNNKYSVVSICNWQKYQSGDDISIDNKMTTDRQQNDTKQEVRSKNKEKREILTPAQIKNLKEDKEFQLKDIDLEYRKACDWLMANGKTKKNYLAFFRNWLRRDLDNKKKSNSHCVLLGGEEIPTKEEFEKLVNKKEIIFNKGEKLWQRLP